MFTRRLQRAITQSSVGSSLLRFISGFPGGGGQSAIDVSPFDETLLISGSDTGGVRISNDAHDDAYINLLGIDETRSRQTDGVKFSRIVMGRVYMTCGDGTAGQGGVYVAEDVDDPTTVGAWKKLDGVVSGSPDLIFDGGNNTGSAAPQATYPRHYGNNIEIDEVTQPGYTLIHVATTTNGAWRIKVQNSNLTPVEQIQYGTTSGKYIRCIKMATYAPNDTANDYSRLIISTYDTAAPSLARLCTTANDISGSPTLTTTALSNLPTNIEAFGYIKAAGGSMQAVTVVCANGYVGFSTNAFSAVAGSVAMTEVSQVSGAPERSEIWISAGSTHNGSQYIVLVGTWGGVGSGSSYNTLWRGTWTGTSTTPWSAVSWTALAGPTYWSEQVMNRPGADNLWWLYGSNTPGLNGTAAVSGFATSKTNPARVYAFARGNSYISEDHGLHWYSSNVFGSADHQSAYWYRAAGRRSTFVTNTGDWPLAGSIDAFATQPHAILRNGYNANTSWEDFNTGECFVGGTTAGGSSVPPLDNGNTVWGVDYADLGNTSTSPSILTDYNLNTGDGANTNVGGVLCGVTTYNTGGTGSTRTIAVGTMGGKGLWWTTNNGTTWNKVSAASGTQQPYDTSSNFDSSQAWWDAARDRVYFMDRAAGIVWRCTVQASGALSTATALFGDSWTYSVAPNACGYIDTDTANDRLWVSTLNGVWYIDNASTAAFSTTKSNATSCNFATNYPGEYAGAMAFIPHDGSVVLATLGLKPDRTQTYAPTLNGTDGPRFLKVTAPLTLSSWNSSNAEDWGVTQDRRYKVGYMYPHNIARNHDGSIIALSMQGCGIGLWKSV
ncbi:MAG: hypothetical protein ABIQ64_04605 [Candidatus Saccharimonadales bacterium]